MQIEGTANSNEYKCWLTPDELDAIVAVAEERSLKHKVVIQLGARVGLRAFEMTQIRPRHVHQEEESYWLRIPAGKDTEHGTGKPRDAYLPDNVERELLELRYSEELDEDNRFFSVTPGRIRQIVSEAADEVATRTEQGHDLPGSANDWDKVSSHDLRRFFAHDCLVRNAMNPRVVMEVGGWSSFSAIEPYLNKPTKQNIASEFCE